jgi:hypothetical protein
MAAFPGITACFSLSSITSKESLKSSVQGGVTMTNKNEKAISEAKQELNTLIEIREMLSGLILQVSQRLDRFVVEAMRKQK